MAFFRDCAEVCLTLVVMSSLCLAYVLFIWRRIPFIGASFTTAVEVIKSNAGLIFSAFTLQLWAISLAIVLLVSCTWAVNNIGLWIVIFFLMSYFWIEEVLKNMMHVTAAAWVGDWWTTPRQRHAKIRRITLWRAFTYSFGSICFGSLFVNYFHGLRNLVTATYDKRYHPGCSCIYLVVSCLFGCARKNLTYMNKWAFVYVGLYGYSFFEAGKNVTILFNGRGWKRMVTDDLSDNILFVLNLAVAASTGMIGWFFSNQYDHYTILSQMYSDPSSAGFIIGCLVGYLVSAVLIGTFGGVVNGIIVCFAENPVALHNNHPRHSRTLRDGFALDLPVELKGAETQKSAVRWMM